MPRNIVSTILIICALYSCKTLPDRVFYIETLNKEFHSGNFTALVILADSAKRILPGDRQLMLLADSLIDLSHRIRHDFPHTQQDIRNLAKASLPAFSPEKLEEWEAKKWLEYRVIDGEKRYFDRAFSNLMLLKDFYENREQRFLNISNDQRIRDRLEHTKRIANLSGKTGEPAIPVTMKINYKIAVEADAVPEGEVIRCWLPWPAKGQPRQSAPELISASDTDYIIAPDTCIHSTLYMEKKAVKGEQTIFEIAFRYTSSGQYFDYEKITAKPYDTAAKLYREFTREELPHITFSPVIRKLADSICLDSDDPKAVVRDLYQWFKDNVPWTGAQEYSIMPDIPAYVCENLRGDCGMQTFLFLSMLRYKGIPARWQSGWMVPPGAENLHDWSEVWFEGTGWVPSDVSYDLQNSAEKKIREFYLSGIDSYRMIVNQGIAGKLFPEKEHRRSEPYDFQRGEVEWRGGNLYFDKWDYTIKIEYNR